MLARANESGAARGDPACAPVSRNAGPRGGLAARHARGAGLAAAGGFVHLVGAGPGDPDLLTVKAARLLGEAEVCVHDHLVGAGVLALLPVCVFFFLIQRYLVQGLTAGAVKG